MQHDPTALSSQGNFPKFLTFIPRDVIIVLLAVFIAALAGTVSRPTGFLAAFWPANAVLAGLLVREPRMRTLPAVIGATAGYLAAAFVCGDSSYNAVLLTAANLTGALTFTALFGALEPVDRSLARPQGVISLLVLAGAASGLAGLVGALALSGITQLGYVDGLMSWFAAELVNYLAILPVMLTAPPPAAWFRRPRMQAIRQATLPVLAVGFALALSVVVSHPISIVFPVPALIWCALALPMSATAILVMLYSVLAMLGLKLGLYDLGVDFSGVMATHLGVALVALGPVVIASVNADRRKHLEHLERLALYDQLTGTLSRPAFIELGEALMPRLNRERTSVAVMLIDVDHFKSVNDTHGHLSGDHVLTAIAAAIRLTIRQEDLFGRLGGEEFALVLPRMGLREAMAVGERMRSAVEKLAMVVEGGALLRVTISVGIGFRERAGSDLREMVSLADTAMYEAKRAGRNRVMVRESQRHSE